MKIEARMIAKKSGAKAIDSYLDKYLTLTKSKQFLNKIQTYIL